MSELLNDLQKLSSLRVSFSVSVDSGIGSQTVLASPEQLIEILYNPVKGYANLLGVSKADYIQCHEEEFNVECSAITVKGKKCRQIVRGGHSVTVQQWANLNGEYCQIHGG